MNKWRDIYDSKESKNPWKHPPSAPLYLDVEPTNCCNFNCSFCVGKQQMKRPKGYMDFNLFKEICIQAYNIGVKGIRFLRWGEPLLHPNILEMVKLAKEYGMLTHITTNGSKLDNNMIVNLNMYLDSIIISMQGTNEREYKTFRGNNYEKILKNIEHYKELRDSCNDETYIIISTTITDESKEEIKAFKDRMLLYADDVSIGYTWFKRLENKEPVKDLIERAKKLPHYFKCQEVMVKLSIDWDGTVSPCCLDYDQQLTVGNIKNNTLMELWESEQTKAIRTLLTNKRQDIFTLCRTCELNYDFRGKE
jgi:radical SAM protein with 4Fe4S-binding SPASM domain